MRQRAGEDKVPVQITELPRLPPRQEGRAAAANSTTLQAVAAAATQAGVAGKARGSRFMWGELLLPAVIRGTSSFPPAQREHGEGRERCLAGGHIRHIRHIRWLINVGAQKVLGSPKR